MKVRFHPLAERELIAAALYLDTEAGGGAEFLKSYETWEAQVREYPELGNPFRPFINLPQR